jgi:hypothetical protein
LLVILFFTVAMSASIASYAEKVNEEQVVGLAVVGLRLVGLDVDGLEVVSWDVVVTGVSMKVVGWAHCSV